MRDMLATDTVLQLWTSGEFCPNGANAVATVLAGPESDAGWWMNATQQDVDELHGWFLSNRFHNYRSVVLTLSGSLLTALVVGFIWWLQFAPWITVGLSIGASILSCALASLVVDWVGERFFNYSVTQQMLALLRPLGKIEIQEFFDGQEVIHKDLGMHYFKEVSQRRRLVHQDVIVVEKLISMMPSSVRRSAAM